MLLSRIASLTAAAAMLALGCKEEPIELIKAGEGDPATEQAATGGGPASIPDVEDNEDPTKEQTGNPSNVDLPGDRLFVLNQVLDISVTIDELLLQELDEHGDEEIYKNASVSILGTGIEAQFAEAGFRYKGSWSLHHCWDDFEGVRSYEDDCAKLSYKIKFNKFEEEGRLDGLKRLNLHALSGDASKLRDLLSYEVFRSFGVDAPRTALARVEVNGAAASLFLVVEAVDGRYTKAHYPEGGDGNLYKERWPQAGVAEEDYIEALKTNDDAPDVSAMLGFASAIGASTNASFAADMLPYLNLEHTLRYIAVDRALKNWDGIMAFYSPETSHNFYWYQDDAVGLFHLIPWDLDGTFWEFDPYMYPEDWATAAPVPDWNMEPANCSGREVWEPGSGVRITPPRCDALLDRLAEGHWPQFAALGAELLEGPLALEALNAQVDHWEGLLEALVLEDPLLELDGWHGEVASFRANLDPLRNDFSNFILQGLIAEPEVVVPEFFDDLTENAGLLVGAVTNFEFEVLEGGEVAGIYSVLDDSATMFLYLNEDDPISGTADLKADIVFQNNPGEYDEWVNIGLTSAVSDVSAFTSITMTMRTDIPRTVRIRIRSDAYDNEWGEIWYEFGQYFEVGPDPTEVVLRFAQLSYPDWAKDSWEEGQGFSTTDEEALALALSTFTGLLLNPEPSWDEAGVLPTETEAASIQIDNIYFQ